MLIKVPNGLLEGPDHFNLIEIDELRGKQQNYLADKDLVVGNIGHIPKILEDMVLSVQTEAGIKWRGKLIEVIQRLPSNDLETILIKIRENTYGPRFYHEATCPFCNEATKDLRLDLDQLKVDFLTANELATVKSVLLPKTNIEAELKPIYLADMFKIVDITKKSNELVTSILALSIKRLGDKSPVEPKDIDNIPASDLRAIQQYMNDAKIEGTIDTNIELECSKCKKEFSIKLNCFDPSFFDPTKGYTSLNTSAMK
jgi:hypothetical protein